MFVVFGDLPLVNGFAVVDEDLEESVHEEDAVGLDRARVEQHRLGRPVERVGKKRRLDHQQTVLHWLRRQLVAEIGRFVRRVAENLTPLKKKNLRS